MTTLCRWLLPMLLAACAAQPPNRQDVQAKSGALPIRFEKTDIGVRFDRGALHCGKDYGDCMDIPVVVLELADRCLALVPYKDAVVHHGPGATVVRWVLHPSKGYKFRTDMDGVQFDAKEPYTDVYEGKDNKVNSFQWVIKPNAPKPQTFHHWANVVRDDNNQTPCEAVDPTITNQN